MARNRLSSLPHVFEVGGRIARDDVDDVDANILGLAEEARYEELGGGCHPLQAAQVERAMRRRDAGPGLDLDEGEQLAAAGNQIDLADWRPHPFGENLPPFAAQIGRGLRFGAASAAFGLDPRFAQRTSSSARS